jgi:hypothetical protein
LWATIVRQSETQSRLRVHLAGGGFSGPTHPKSRDMWATQETFAGVVVFAGRPRRVLPQLRTSYGEFAGMASPRIVAPTFQG